MPEPLTTEALEERRGYVLEIITAIVLGLSTLGAAYAAYQASRCDGNSLDHYSEGISRVAEASGKQLEAQGGFTFDMITWMQWQTYVIAAENETGAQSKIDEMIYLQIYNEIMEDRMKDAIDWADKQSKIKKTTVHPTESDEYGLALFGEAVAKGKEADEAIADARKASDLGDKFTLLTVLFTIVLFFSGIATVFKRYPVKLSLLIMAIALFGFTAVKLLMLPGAG